MTNVEKPNCALCGYPIAADSIEDVDGKHYHRVCNTASASTLYRDSLSRIAELEARYSDVVAEHENELALRLEAEATIERLKCCGNCSLRHVVSLGERCSISGWLVTPQSHCQLTPSRWAERGGE